MLYADDLVLMTETIKRLKRRVTPKIERNFACRKCVGNI